MIQHARLIRVGPHYSGTFACLGLIILSRLIKQFQNASSKDILCRTAKNYPPEQLVLSLKTN